MKMLKDNSPPNKETDITRTKIKRKIRTIRKKLKTLYKNYKILQITKTNESNMDHLIDIISKMEYKYICCLRKQYEQGRK